MLLKAFIVSHETVQPEGPWAGPSFTVFVIDVYVNGIRHSIRRRYSEFEDLHKILKKRVVIPNFPPKTPLNRSSKVIEDRKKRLEAYIQEVLRLRYYTPKVLEFLKIPKDQLEDGYDNEQGSRHMFNHMNEDSLTMCPFAKSSSPVDEQTHQREISPDIILQGLYKTFYVT